MVYPSKHYFEAAEGSTSRKNKKRLIKDILKEMNSTIRKYKLKLDYVRIVEDDFENSSENFDLVITKKREGCCDVDTALKYKDLNNISDQKYVNVRKGWHIQEFVPSIECIRLHRKKLNQIFPHLKNDFGVFINIELKLKHILSNITEKIGKIADNTIILKITGDGTNASYNMKLFNLCFSIINDEEKCMTSKGTYIIGTYEIDENYKNLEKSLEEVSNQLESLKEIQTENMLFKIKKVCTHDLKGAQIFNGTTDSTSKYPCPFCEICFNLAGLKKIENVHLTQFKNTLDGEWSYCDLNLGARSLEANQICLNNKEKGYIHKPLFPFIPYQNNVPDSLHMNLMRIMERLLELFLNVLNIQDIRYQTSQKDKRIALTDSILDQPNLKNFANFLEDGVGIYKVARKNNGKYELKSFRGFEREKTFAFINNNPGTLNFYFGGISQISEIEKLWIEYYSIYWGTIRKQLNYLEIKKRTREWLNDFLKIYKLIDVTPYIHIFVHHLWEYVRDFGDINLYNMQGNEKFNDLMKSYYFTSTNKDRNKKLDQLIQKRNRCELHQLSLN